MQNSADDSKIWLSWLTRLRWVALTAQVITLGFAFPLLESMRLVIPLTVVVLFLLGFNLHATKLLQRGEFIDETTILAQLSIDVVALTAFFLLAGGPTNPFTILYLVHVAMGAVMLAPPQAATLTVAVLGCYGLLHLWHLPLNFNNHIIDARTLRPLGQLLAFTVTSTSVAIFVVGLADTLARRTAQLLDARDRTSRIDRLRSVGTLAAGAAHELNTPLSTIGLRIRRIRRRYDDIETQKDLNVIDEQLRRCTRTVQQLLAGAGDPSAVGMEETRLIDLVEDSVKMWSLGSTLEAKLTDHSAEVRVNLPRVAFAQALCNLLENARQAQEAIQDIRPLEIMVEQFNHRAIVKIRDHGCGLPPEKNQVGTPFFTTKSTGTGLGVFVARQVADGAGGGLRYTSHTDGTTAMWWFPSVPPGTRRSHEPER